MSILSCILYYFLQTSIDIAFPAVFGDTRLTACHLSPMSMAHVLDFYAQLCSSSNMNFCIHTKMLEYFPSPFHVKEITGL
jgi:hypothetical protein